MEFIFPTLSLNGPVWASLFCSGDYAELVNWVHEARGPMLGMGFALDVNWDPRFLRLLQILTGTSDVSISYFYFFIHRSYHVLLSCRLNVVFVYVVLLFSF